MEYKDYTHLTWDTNPNKSSGTGGTFYKAIDKESKPVKYYKLSNWDSYDKKVIGYESVFEVVVYNLGRMLNIPILEYRLIPTKISIEGCYVDTFITESDCFRPPGSSKLSFETFVDLYNADIKPSPDLTPVDIININNFQDYFYKMFILDYIIINRDRHGANIEMYIQDGSYYLTPMFDNGLSFIAPYGMDEVSIKNYNELSDAPVNNYVGSRSLKSNLDLIYNTTDITPLPSNWKEQLFVGTYNALPDFVKDKIIDIVEVRYNYVKSKSLFNY